MDLNELTTKLEGIEGGEEMAAFVKSLADDNKKKNNEAKNLRDRSKKAEADIVALTEKFTKVASFVGLEDDTEDLENALEALKQKQVQLKADGTKGQPNPELAAVTSQLNQLQRDLKKITQEKDTFAKNAEQEKNKRIELMRDSVLQKALSEGKAVKPSQLSKLLRDNIKIADDGSESFVFTADDGNELTVQEGVKSFLEANPEFVLNGSNPGAGSGANGGKTLDFDNMSQEQYKKWRETQK